MRINNNVSALNSWRQLSNTDRNMDKSLEKLSSGYRINRAADDAAGLAISEKMRGQIRGLNQATRNAQDGISLLQTAEGALNESHAILQRMRELTVQAGNGTNETQDLAAIQAEIDALIEELDGIATRTQFNGKDLLDGSFTGVDLQIGANAGQQLTISIDDMRSTALGVNGVDVTSIAFDTDITLIDTAIETVSAQRSDLGALQNRLEHTINNLGVAAENLTAAESRIRDVDMALEMAEFTKHNILLQAGTSMLSQANMKPQNVLQLLG